MAAYGIWMGIAWIAVAIFIIVSDMLGSMRLRLPYLRINPGWIIVVLGMIRIWWWWISYEKPRRRQAELRVELRELERQRREQERLDVENESAASSS